MRLINAFKYQILSASKAMFMFYGIMVSLRLFGVIVILATGNKEMGMMSAMESNTFVFMVFLGVFSIIEDFKFFVQNGYSRKSLIKLYIMQFVATALMLAFLDLVIAHVFELLYPYKTLYAQIYGAQNILLEYSWMVMLYLCAGIVSFFLTVLFQRLDKMQRIIVMLLLPVAVIVLVPVLDYTIFQGSIIKTLIETMLMILGLYQGIHVFVPLASFVLIFAVFAGLSYLTIRRSSVFLM